LLTDPIDGTSRFEFAVEATPSGHSLSFQSLVGRRYVVECSLNGVQFDEVVTVQGTGDLVQPSLGPNLALQLYRVRIELAE